MISEQVDILDLGISGALYHVVLAIVCHAMKISSNATDALIEDIRVEVLKFQMPSCKTYAEINCRMKLKVTVTADRSLKCYAKKHNYIITKVCEYYTFIRQLKLAYVLQLDT